MKFVLVLLLAIAGVGYADVTPTASAETKLFFEPTQADYDCCSSAVKAQDAAYKKAKKAGNYDEAVRLALFNWTRAWLHYNKGLDIAQTQEGWTSITALNEAIGYLEKAEADAVAAGESSQAADCLAKAAKNKKLIAEQLKALEKLAGKSK